MERKVTQKTMARQELDHTYVKKNPSRPNIWTGPKEIDSFDGSCMIASLLGILSYASKGPSALSCGSGVTATIEDVSGKLCDSWAVGCYSEWVQFLASCVHLQPWCRAGRGVSRFFSCFGGECPYPFCARAGTISSNRFSTSNIRNAAGYRFGHHYAI